MAFWDFIKAMRPSEGEEKRRDTRGGASNRVFGFLDDVMDTGERAVGRSPDQTAEKRRLDDEEKKREEERRKLEEATKKAEEKRKDSEPEKDFIGLDVGEGKNKTIFGRDVSGLIPGESFDKVYNVKVGREFKAKESDFISGFDELNKEKKDLYLSELQKMANEGNEKAVSSLNTLRGAGKLKGDAMDFVEGSNERLLGGTTRGLVRTADMLLPGKNTFGLEEYANDTERVRKVTDTGKAGETAGTIQKGALDLAAMAIPGAKVDKAVQGARVIKGIDTATKGGKAASYVARIVPGSLVSSGIDMAQEVGRGNEVNPTRSVGVGLGADLLLPAVLKGAVKGGKRLIGKGGEAAVDAVAKNADEAVSAIDGEVSHITKSSNLDSILAEGKLKPNAPPLSGYEGQNAVYLNAGTKNPYGFAGEDNINIVYNGSTLPNKTINGDELAVAGGVDNKLISYIEVPDEKTAQKVIDAGYEARVKPELSASYDNLAPEAKANRMATGTPVNDIVPGGPAAPVRGSADQFLDAATPKTQAISTSGGARPYDDIQRQIEQAHNSGNDDAIDGLLEKIPEADRAGIDPRAKSNMRPVVDPVTKKITMQPAAGADGFVDAALPKTAATAPSGAGVADDAEEELLGRMKSTSEIDAMKEKLPLKQRIYEQLFNKNASFDEFGRRYKEVTGQDLPQGMDPAAIRQLSNGQNEAAGLRLRPVEDALVNSGNLDDVRKLGIARQILDRADKMPEKTVDLARRTIASMEGRMQPEQLAKVDAAVKAVNDFYDKQLRDLVDVGRLTEESYNVIKEANPNYFGKVSIVEHILDSPDLARFGNSGSHNMARENLIKAVKGIGSDEKFQIADPVEAMSRSALAVEKAVRDTKLFKAIKEFENIDPEMVQTVRASEDVLKRMGLSLENKEMRPIRDKAARMIKTRSKWVSKLETQVNNLNKEGLKTSLKEGGAQMPEFAPTGLGGKVPTSKAVDSKLGPRDTASFVRSLVEGPNAKIVAIRKKIGTKDVNMNKILDDIEGLQKEYDDVAQRMASNSEDAKLLMDKEVPKGMKIISNIQSGVVERVAVPEEIYKTFTGMNEAQRDVVSGTMKKLNKVAKEMFTTYNPAFALVTNPIRDVKNSMFKSEAVPLKDYVFVLPYAKRWAESFWGSLVGDEVAQRLTKAGAGGAGQFVDEINPEKFATNLRRQTNGVEITNVKDFMKEVGHLLGTPGRGIKKVGSAIESATRGVEGRAVLKATGDIDQAALAARRVSTDFAEGGKAAQGINNFLNFFNARLQGTKTVYTGIKQNPKRAAAAVTAAIAIPSTTAYLYNYTQHKDVLDQIDQPTKDNNWIFIYGDGVDDKGKPNQFVTVPKGDAEKLFSMPIENALQRLGKDDPATLSELAVKMLSNVSPVDFQKDGEMNLSRTVGGLMPSAVSGAVQVAANKNFYNDSPIIPKSLEDMPAEQQVRDNTSSVDKFIAKALPGEQSPLKIEALRRSVTGNLVGNPADNLKGPLTASANAPQSEFYKIKNKADQNRASASEHINQALASGNYDEAYRTVDAYNAYLVKTFTPFSQRYGKYMTPDLIEQYDGLKLNLTKRSIKQRMNNLQEKQQSATISGR